jgi:hypothetical protein
MASPRQNTGDPSRSAGEMGWLTTGAIMTESSQVT